MTRPRQAAKPSAGRTRPVLSIVGAGRRAACPLAGWSPVSEGWLHVANNDAFAKGICDKFPLYSATGCPLIVALASLAANLADAATLPFDAVVDVKILASDGAEDADFGEEVSGAGDFDADGYDDVLVVADDGYPWDGHEGQVYVFYGSASGIDAGREDKLVPPDLAPGTFALNAAAMAGDLDADGFDDVIVGDEWYDDEGVAWAFFGGPAGIDPARAVMIEPSLSSWIAPLFGNSVAGAGDIDADGYGDVFVNAGQNWTTFVYYGGPTAIDATREDQVTPTFEDDDMMGVGPVAGAGDVDGDGFADVVVGDSGNGVDGLTTGAAYVYYGAPTGIDRARESKLYASDREVGEAFGASVAGAGDVNGDGFDDVIVGAPYFAGEHEDSGAVYLYLGSTPGVDLASEQQLTPSDAAGHYYFGCSVAGVGDVDVDGFDDVAVGGSHLFLGSAAGIDVSTEVLLSESAGSAFSYDVSAAGDVNADGLADVIVGYTDDAETAVRAGAAFLYLGGLGIDADADGVTTASDCDDADASVGAASIRAYADDDGDGYGDPAAGSMLCDNEAGYATSADDCDDTDPAIHPGAPDPACDGVDQGCDGGGGNDSDEDGDGWPYEYELALGTDPCSDDSDGDGLLDSEDPDPLGAQALDSGGTEDSREAETGDPADAAEATGRDGCGDGCGGGSGWPGLQALFVAVALPFRRRPPG